MRLAHSIAVSVFVKPEENADNVRSSFIALFPFDLPKEKIVVASEKVTSFEDRSITILTVRLLKESHIRLFLDHLLEQLNKNEQAELYLQRESRLSEDLQFYIRLDKDGVERGIFRLTDGGNCVHIRIAIAAYPKKREVALGVLDKIFKEELGVGGV